MRLWLKTCPRCRQGPLLDDKVDLARVVTCTHCAYVLSPSEARFIIEDIVLADEPALQRTAAAFVETPRRSVPV
jgi:ribosomal protein S27AE